MRIGFCIIHKISKQMVGIESANEDLTVQERSVTEAARAKIDLQRSVRSTPKSKSTVVEKATKIQRLERLRGGNFGKLVKHPASCNLERSDG